MPVFFFSLSASSGSKLLDTLHGSSILTTPLKELNCQKSKRSHLDDVTGQQNLAATLYDTQIRFKRDWR